MEEDQKSGSPLNLTDRLLEVVEAAVRGLADKQIAAELGISTHTIDSHWRRLRESFGATNRAEAIAKFLNWRHQQALDALGREIEVRKAVEEQLREANERLSAALEERDTIYARLLDAHARTVWTDSDERDRLLRLEKAIEASGTMLYESEYGGAWRKLWATRNFEQLGYSFDDFIAGRLRVVEFMPGEDVMANLVLFEKAVATGANAFTCYYRFRTAGGELRWIRDRMTLIRDETGKVTRYFGAGTDVTDLARRIEPAILLHAPFEEP